MARFSIPVVADRGLPGERIYLASWLRYVRRTGDSDLVTEPSTRALKAQWFQKWMVHRRLRPEEFGGRVEVQRLGRRSYPFHSDLGSSSVLGEVFSEFGSHFLPLAFPEGSPSTHFVWIRARYGCRRLR